MARTVNLFMTFISAIKPCGCLTESNLVLLHYFKPFSLSNLHMKTCHLELTTIYQQKSFLGKDKKILKASLLAWYGFHHG